MIFNNILKGYNFSNMIRKIYLLFMLMFGFSSVLLSQHQEKPYYRFGENLNFTSSFGYTIYSTEDLNDYHIRYFDNQFTMSLDRYFSAGLHYNHIFISDVDKKKYTFFRAGPIIRYYDISKDNKWFLHVDAMLDYGNFVIEVNEELNKRKTLYLGLKLTGEYNIFSNCNILLGHKIIRQLEKAGYGLENYTFTGLSFRFNTTKKK